MASAEDAEDSAAHPRHAVPAGRPPFLAIIEAGERGLADVLSPEFEPAPHALSSVLTYCDMTTSPDGEPYRSKGDSPRYIVATATGTW